MPYDWSGLEAMVVDDDPDIRDLLADFLKERGLTVATAADGRAAVAGLERSGGRYGLVLTDINMPGADGFEVLRAARVANASAYVVVITGYASIDSAVRAVRLGAYDYLAKPFTLGQIDVLLSGIAQRLTLERENRALVARAAAAAPSSLEARLAAIERRLAALEARLPPTQTS